MSTEAFSIHEPRGSLKDVLSLLWVQGALAVAPDWLSAICSAWFICSRTNALHATTGSTCASFRTREYLRRRGPTGSMRFAVSISCHSSDSAFLSGGRPARNKAYYWIEK